MLTLEAGEWYVYVNGGRIKTEKKLFDWAREAAEQGGRGDTVYIHES